MPQFPCHRGSLRNLAGGPIPDLHTPSVTRKTSAVHGTKPPRDLPLVYYGSDIVPWVHVGIVLQGIYSNGMLDSPNVMGTSRKTFPDTLIPR